MGEMEFTIACLSLCIPRLSLGSAVHPAKRMVKATALEYYSSSLTMSGKVKSVNSIASEVCIETVFTYRPTFTNIPDAMSTP